MHDPQDRAAHGAYEPGVGGPSPLRHWGAIPGRRQTEIAVLALLERGACAFALSRTGRGELLHGVSVLHVPEAIQNARVIGAIARLKHRPVSIELVTCIAHEACRGRIPASSQRVEDALVVPLLLVERRSRERAENSDEQ